MKVFSVSKWVEDSKRKGYSDSAIRRYLLSWAAKCHGLTEKEMKKFGLLSHENWMEERKEEK